MSDEAPRPRMHPALFAGVLVVVAGAGYSAGRFSAPPEVEERVEYRTEIRTVKVQAKAREVVRYVEKTTKPDGTITERSSEREVSKVDTTTRADSSTASVIERRVEVRPDWRIGVLAGASLREPALPITGPLVLGVTVERRIIGGVSLGAWVNTVGAAGASVSVDF